MLSLANQVRQQKLGALNAQIMQQQLSQQEQLFPLQFQAAELELQSQKFSLEEAMKNAPTTRKILDQQLMNEEADLTRIHEQIQASIEQRKALRVSRKREAQTMGFEAIEFQNKQEDYDYSKKAKDAALAGEINAALSINPDARGAILQQFMPLISSDPENHVATINILTSTKNLSDAELRSRRMPTGSATEAEARRMYDATKALEDQVGPEIYGNIIALGEVYGMANSMSPRGRDSLMSGLAGIAGNDEIFGPQLPQTTKAQNAFQSLEDNLADQMQGAIDKRFNGVDGSKTKPKSSIVPQDGIIDLSNVEALTNPDLGKGIDFSIEFNVLDNNIIKSINPASIQKEIAGSVDKLLKSPATGSRAILQGTSGPSAPIARSKVKQQVESEKLKEAAFALEKIAIPKLAPEQAGTVKNFLDRLLKGKIITVQSGGSTSKIDLSSFKKIDKIALIRQLTTIFTSENPDGLIEDISKTNMLGQRERLILDSLLQELSN